MVTNANVSQDLVDPATAIKEACAENHCTAYKAKLDECNDRVKSKNKTTETCFEEILDFYHCVDHCAASEIFKVKMTNFVQTELLDLIIWYIVEREMNWRGFKIFIAASR